MTEFHIYPAGTGTSFVNKIYGLANVNNNAIGAVSGDSLILHGRHFEQFNIPTNDLKIVSDGFVLDGSCSLSNALTLNANYDEVSLSNWKIVDAGLNVWKKGLHNARIMLKDYEFMEPMPSGRPSSLVDTILGSIAVNEWTMRSEDLDTLTSAVYVRLPSGEHPNDVNLRVNSGERYNDTAIQTGALVASQKTGISIEGVIESICVNPRTGMGGGFFIDRCIGFDTTQGKLSSKYDYVPLYVVAGDDIVISADAQYCFNTLQIAAANHVSGAQYTGGDIEFFNCNTNRVGWLPYYIGNSGTPFAWGDADGGVAIGQRGGTLSKVVVRDGVHQNCGPSLRANKAGWGLAAATIGKGYGIVASTVDTMSIAELNILNNKILGGNGGGIFVGSAGITKLKVKIQGNLVKDVRAPAFSEAPSIFNQAINADEGNAAHPASVIEITDNAITGCAVSNSVIQSRRYNASSSVLIANNISSGNSLETGFSATNYGHIRIVDSIATARTINKNICDAPISGTFGRIGANSYATKALFDAATGGETTEGTVTVNSDGSVTAGTANPIGTGFKYWGTNARPLGINGQPKPDEMLDIGCYQSTLNPFHPANL